MERFNNVENSIKIENDVLENLNLLKIAKSYCEENFNNSEECGILSILLDVILKKQQSIFHQLVN